MRKRRKAKGGNRKGRPFEILTAKILSLWWTGGKDDFVFYHSHSSGAMATSNSKLGKSRKGHHGDIAHTKSIGEPFTNLICVECKKGYNSSTVMDFIDGGRFNHRYSKWIIKARSDMRATGAKYWWIIHRRDAKEILLTCPKKFWDTLSGSDEMVNRKMNLLPTTTTIARTKKGKWVRLVTVPLEEFLNAVTPQNIKEIA